MKSTKYMMLASMGLGLSLLTTQVYAADAPRHLSVDDDNTASAKTIDAPQIVSELVLVTPKSDEMERIPTGLTQSTPADEAAGSNDAVIPSPETAGIQDTTETAAQADAPTDNADADLSADPFERVNRKIFAANEALDKVTTKPVARGYKKIVPAGIRRCVSNMFDNLGTPYTAANNVLQGKIKSAGQDLGRVVVNSVLGVGGCFDVATKFGIPKHDEDFGQTLGVWGVPSGRYVVLPFYGPSSVRDLVAKPIDMFANPIGYITNIPLRNSLTGYKLLDTRTNLLEATDILDESAIDKYTMVRDAWAQRREAQVRDEDGSYDNVSVDQPQEPRQLEK